MLCSESETVEAVGYRGPEVSSTESASDESLLRQVSVHGTRIQAYNHMLVV